VKVNRYQVEFVIIAAVMVAGLILAVL